MRVYKKSLHMNREKKRKQKRKQREISSLRIYNIRLHPYAEASKIAVIYGIVGLLWILFSDELLAKIVRNVEVFRKLSTYKGFAFVLVTVILIYLLILNRMILLDKALNEIDNKFEELNSANEELKLIGRKLNSLAYYDTLTELPNRTCFETEVTSLINNRSIYNKSFALISMDIDNFKHINDTIGHASGDLLLKHIAKMLKFQIKSPDLVARLSGDEFAIIFNNINDRKEVADKLHMLINNLRKPWVYEKREFFISFSIGIAIYPEDGCDLNTLLKNSDIAMYQIKKKMKDNFNFYSIDMLENNEKYICMVNELRHAIEKAEFALHFQPIVNLNNNKLETVEALIRWVHPEKGIISPLEFIPLAEETGLIIDIGEWVIRTALMQKKNWEDKGYPHIKMSVNVSGKGLSDYEFVNHIRELLSETGLNSEEIQIEVTETAIMANINSAVKILKEIKDMGIKIALDDFGTGYSSLTYLKKLPIDTVKLDKDFIKSISRDGKDNVIVESVIRLTQDLNLEIVAEGIETEEQLSFLKLNKCNFGQGYLFSKPVTSEELEKTFKKN